MADQSQQGPNYLDILDPYGAIQAQQIARRQAMAQALLGQGMQGMPGTSMAGQVAIRNSPLQGISNLANVYLGGKGLMDTATQSGQLLASRLDALNQQNQSFGQNPPAGGVNPMAGMTPQQITAWQLQNPGEYQKAVAASNLQQQKPTEVTLSGTQAGMPPEIVQALNAKLAGKQVSNLVHDRDGNLWDLTQRKVVSNAPRLPPGMTYPTGPDGMPDTSRMVPVPNAFAGIEQGAQAQARGTTAGGLSTIQNPSGGTSVVPNAGLLGPSPFPMTPQQAGQQGGIAPPVQPGPAGMPPPQIPRPAPIQQGQTTSDAQIQQAAGQHIAALPAAKAQLMQTRTSLELALQQMENLPKSGPGTEPAMQWLAIANNLPGGQGLTDPVAAYQLVHKYLSNAVSTAAQTNGMGGSDARFEALAAGNPNEKAMNLTALKSATRYVLSQIDGGVIGADQQVNGYMAAGRSPQAALQAQQGWTNQYNPTVLAYNRMAPDERKQFIASMQSRPPVIDPKTGAKIPAIEAFRQQYNAAAAKGWVQ
jgi:hypothetical protein